MGHQCHPFQGSVDHHRTRSLKNVRTESVREGLWSLVPSSFSECRLNAMASKRHLLFLKDNRLCYTMMFQTTSFFCFYYMYAPLILISLSLLSSSLNSLSYERLKGIKNYKSSYWSKAHS